MNIFHKAALESMKRSRTRTAVTVIGVILSAAMITAVASFVVSLQTYLVNSAVLKNGGWHAAFLDVGSAFVRERANDSEAEETAVIHNIGYSVLEGGMNPDKPYLFIAGFPEDSFGKLPIHLISGRLPLNSGEVVISSHVKTNGGAEFALGDTLSLEVGERMNGDKRLGQHDPYIVGAKPGFSSEKLVPVFRKTYTVVGICERPSYEEYTAPGYTVITMDGETGENGRCSLFVKLRNPRHVRSYAAQHAQNHSYVLNENVLLFMGLSDNHWFNTLMYAFGGVLMALIMAGSVFLIYNSFAISLNERIRQFGILSSVGATPAQLRNSVLFEGLCIGAAGIPAGIAVGIGSIWLAISLVGGIFGDVLLNGVPLDLVVSVPALAVAAAVSMASIMISAYIPAKKAAYTPVMESIRQTNQVRIENRMVKTSKLTERFFGLPGMLAAKNFKRNRKRYRSIVLSLTLSTVLFISASAFTLYIKQAAEQMVVDVDYDICFSTKTMNENQVFGLYDELKTAEGVYKSSYQAILEYSCRVKAGDFTEQYREFAGYNSPEQTDYLTLAIQFIEDGEYLKFLEELGLPSEQYTGENAKLTAVAKVNLHEQEDKKGGLSDLFGQRSMRFSIAPVMRNGSVWMQEQIIDVTFVDTIPLDTLPRRSNAPESTVFMAVAPYGQKQRFEVPGGYKELGLTFLSHSPAKSAAQMEEMTGRAGIASDYDLQNVHRIMEQNRNLIFVVNVFSRGFILMISLIAIANVFNTISTNIRLRRREFAMLRSVGMTDRDFNRMMIYECAYYGMKVLAYGLPAAAMFSWLIFKALVLAGQDDIVFVLPWGSMAAAAFSVFFVVCVTMLYAVRRIKKENIIDALRDDMT